MLASTSRGPSPLSLQATTRALHTHTFHCHTNTYSSTRTILRRNSCFHTRETPNGAYFHVGKYPTGHKTRILQIHQRDSPDFESLLWGNRWTHYRSFTTQLNRHRSIPTETLHTHRTRPCARAPTGPGATALHCQSKAHHIP